MWICNLYSNSSLKMQQRLNIQQGPNSWADFFKGVGCNSQKCKTQTAWAVLATKLYYWATVSSSPWFGPRRVFIFRGRDCDAQSCLQKTEKKPPVCFEPQLRRSQWYILSAGCHLAPLPPHNERSHSPQPGATPSTLFTLLPFTHSSCSSPNEAGPGQRWSKAGSELLCLWPHFKPGLFFVVWWNWILWTVTFQSFSFREAHFPCCQWQIFILACLLVSSLCWCHFYEALWFMSKAKTASIHWFNDNTASKILLFYYSEATGHIYSAIQGADFSENAFSNI